MSKVRPVFESWARLDKLQKSAIRHPPLRWLLLIIILAIIPIWQFSFWRAAATLDDSYVNEASVGGGQGGSASVPFQYYLGLSHVTNVPQAPYSDPLAELRGYCSGHIEAGCLAAYVRENGSRLVVGPGFEPFKGFLFYPDMWIRGDPLQVDVRTAAALGLSFALMVLFSALWAARLEWLGLIFVTLIGSSPFLLWETYAHGNVFAWSAIICIFCLAISLPAMKERPARWVRIATVAIVTGAIIGTGQHLRPEIIPLSAAGIVIFATLTNTSWSKRLAMASLFLVSFWATGHGWGNYFETKHAEAAVLVKAAGGTAAQRIDRPKWFTVWVGLGDFDEKYGYLWDDRAAYYFSALKSHLPGATLESTLRNDVLSTISTDPLWYTRILAKRVWRVLAENTPPSLAVAGYQLRLPIPGPVVAGLTLALILLLVLGRSWLLLKLLAFPAALAATPLLIYSGHGIAYYAMVHLFAMALVAALFIELVLILAARLRASEPVVGSANPTGTGSGPLKEAEA